MRLNLSARGGLRRAWNRRSGDRKMSNGLFSLVIIMELFAITRGSFPKELDCSNMTSRHVFHITACADKGQLHAALPFLLSSFDRLGDLGLTSVSVRYLIFTSIAAKPWENFRLSKLKHDDCRATGTSLRLCPCLQTRDELHLICQ